MVDRRKRACRQRHSWRLLVAFVLCLWPALAGVASAQGAYEITPLGNDPARRVDRYQITLGQGASLWDLGFNRLPMIAIEQGDQKVIELIEQGFKAAYPDREAGLVKPGDLFVLEVPAGTFVSKTVTRTAGPPERVQFESYSGDQLTTFPKDPIVQYRLTRAASPDQVEVQIQGGQSDAVEEAKKIYDVPDPDFLQVRTIRGALAERTAKITVDANRRYLDEFRAVRGRATRTEETLQGLRAYYFDDPTIPFVRVDDTVGDQTDPANFTRTFRIAYHRDGTVRKYVITEAGDSTGALGRPESEVWRRTLPAWQEWLPGTPEALPPFAPAIASSGALQPGRILVLAFRPRIVQASPRPTGGSSAAGGSGLTCAGVPIGMVLFGGVVVAGYRKRTGLW
ncbi:MAG: hypothetical protein IT306_21955 [Chloroflexi bacterium]|nr:hypothetical protein [Chloroflexota bacterium]